MKTQSFFYSLMIMVLVLFGLSSTSFATVGTPLSQNEVLTATELDISTLIKKTEQSLETYMFQDAHGRSCGLKHFVVEGYQTSDDLLKHALQNFSVITEAYGPIYLCQGYDYFVCETRWSKTSNAWSVVETLCEDF